MHFARPCLIKSDMHHPWLCIMTWLCDGCLLCCLLLSLASVLFRSCEDSFDYLGSSTSWTHSSSLRDLRQDGHTIEITSIFACPLFALPLCCTTYHLFTMPPVLPCQASKPTFLANRCLAMLPLLLGPSYSVASCRWSWSLFHVGTWILLGYHYYILFTLMHLYTW